MRSEGPSLGIHSYCGAIKESTFVCVCARVVHNFLDSVDSIVPQPMGSTAPCHRLPLSPPTLCHHENDPKPKAVLFIGENNSIAGNNTRVSCEDYLFEQFYDNTKSLTTR